ncbi:helix-turn-helix domain-containing protein [Brevundimonas sp.]|uniref:helix-turn-helix domain-containing protein n=1 Tax=Brevundimonas sp. TaxID=1871086 RepID=UPI003F722980
MTPREGSIWPDVVALIGEELAAQMSAAMGGTRLYVPKFAGPNHPLTHVVGDKAAALIVAAMAGEYLLPPIALGRDARIVQLREGGETIDAIASKVGCSRRTVFSVLEMERKINPPQLDLFG